MDSGETGERSLKRLWLLRPLRPRREATKLPSYLRSRDAPGSGRVGHRSERGRRTGSVATPWVGGRVRGLHQPVAGLCDVFMEVTDLTDHADGVHAKCTPLDPRPNQARLPNASTVTAIQMPTARASSRVAPAVSQPGTPMFMFAISF